ncbi:MAG: virulence RhuM family protein, partial [Alphaproteobacteria bacterium]|nr:virulence RhuM family protein [Alphaproteobacteria bacterium]
ERAKASKPNMGLQTWKNAPQGKILKTDVSIAKNYLIEKEIKDLINKKGIVGSIDLRLWENLFTEHFGVTRYMTEVRLKECGVRFLNGVYIKNFNNFKGKNYTLEDLKLLFELGKSFDQELNYYSAEAIVSLFNKATGEVRASGPIYMAYRRLMKGEYDSAFPELSEMRLSFLASKEVEIQKRKELEG